jgi:myo-inositol-1(or 4)-monophosphatase
VAVHRRGELLAGAVVDPLGERTFAAARGGGATLDGEPMKVSSHPGLDGAFLATGYPFRAHAALDRYLGAFKEVFQQARAIRRCGAAALDLAHTAAGIYDGFFEFRLAPWDIAAGLLLIQEAGGRASDLDGTFRCLETGNVVAGGVAVQRDLQAAVGRHADEAALAAVTPETAPAQATTPVGVGED